LATDTLIIEMTNDPGYWILLIRINRAADHAGRLDAMMARRRHRLLYWVRSRSAEENADVAPGFPFIEPVQVVARCDTGLATGTGIEIYGESVLLARSWERNRNQITIILSLCWYVVALVFARKIRDRREKLLLP
jgi:hypothetical protein